MEQNFKRGDIVKWKNDLYVVNIIKNNCLVNIVNEENHMIAAPRNELELYTTKLIEEKEEKEE